MATTRENITLTTPQGHEVRAEMDYERFELRGAKVIHTHTGVMRPLNAQACETLARALRAKQVYEHALSETESVEHTLKRFGKLAEALGNTHPALQPYWQEAAQHRSIAKDMRMQAEHFHEDAMQAIDQLAEGETRH